MVEKILLTSILYFFGIRHSVAQTDQHSFLIDSLIKPFEFVYIKPIQKIYLERELIKNYQYFIEGSGKKKVDTSVLIEIIENSSQLDTSHWQDMELKRAILICNKNESISWRTIIQKFNILKNRSKRNLKKEVDKYNNANIGIVTLPGKRIVSSFSRPIFDKSGRYAVVSYNRPREGHGTTLYQLVNDKWILIGDIERWAY